MGQSVVQSKVAQVTRRCLFSLHLNRRVPWLLICPTMLSGRLFHKWVALLIKVRSPAFVLNCGTVRAWSGINILPLVVRRLTYGGGSMLLRSWGQLSVCILYNAVPAATCRLWCREAMFSLDLRRPGVIMLSYLLFMETWKPKIALRHIIVGRENVEGHCGG